MARLEFGRRQLTTGRYGNHVLYAPAHYIHYNTIIMVLVVIVSGFVLCSVSLLVFLSLSLLLHSFLLPQGEDVLEHSTDMLHSGELHKISKGRSQERHFFLFDHQLVYCKKVREHVA